MVWVAIGLGLGLGVFVNCLADDLPPDDSDQSRPLRAPHCPVCGRTYAWSNWLALVHWITPQGRGRCGYCGTPRTRRALIVEAAMAAATAYAWLWAEGEWTRVLPAVAVLTIFGLITVIDIEHRLILWRVVWVSALLLLLIGIASPERGWEKTLLGGAVGYGIVLGLFGLSHLYMLANARVRGQPLDEVAFGGGDVNLAGLVGLAVGWSGVLFALFIGIFAAGLFSAAIVGGQMLQHRYDPHLPFPYGPFLVLGALIMYFYGNPSAMWWLGGH